MRKHEPAAEYVRRRDPEMRIILAELAESAGLIALWWSIAIADAQRNPERALARLIDADIRLVRVRAEYADTLRAVRTAIRRFEAELPDDDEDDDPGDIAAH